MSQIGYSKKEKLLSQIVKQLDKTIKVGGTVPTTTSTTTEAI